SRTTADLLHRSARLTQVRLGALVALDACGKGRKVAARLPRLTARKRRTARVLLSPRTPQASRLHDEVRCPFVGGITAADLSDAEGGHVAAVRVRRARLAGQIAAPAFRCRDRRRDIGGGKWAARLGRRAALQRRAGRRAASSVLACVTRVT